MAFPQIIKLDELIAPISQDHPAGRDIREDRSPTSDYYTVKDARNSARAAERSAMFDDREVDLLSPWKDVARTAEKILTKKSKDLEVAAWYTEALIRLHGFAGLRDGFVLIGRLIDEYWEALYPEPDEDGLETKVAPLSGLNGDGGDGTLMMPIRNAEITLPGCDAIYSYFHYQQARDADRTADSDAKLSRAEALGYSIGDLNQCIGSASAEWAGNLVETIEASIEHYRKFNGELRNLCKDAAPPYTNISSLLDEVLRTVRFIYKDKLETLAAAIALPGISAVSADSGGSAGMASVAASQLAAIVAGTARPTEPLSSREDALRLLEQAAKYFRTYEPHTPLAPGLERLIDWGRMTVSELMAELLPEDQSRAIYSQLTGVKLDGSDTQRYVAPPVNLVASEAAAANSGSSNTDVNEAAARANPSWDSSPVSNEQHAASDTGW
jgi:type VI secretion system protein ImpA